MKKLLTFIAALIITTSAVFANHEVLAPLVVKTAFETKFGKITNVTWEKILDVYVGRFTSNDNNYEAYFSENGELLASARYISELSLPQLISDTVKSKYSGSDILQVLEFTSLTSGTSYYINITNNKANLVLLVTPGGETTIVRKTKK